MNGRMQKSRATMRKGFVPKTYDNAKVYSGDNFYEPADVIMKNLDFTNYETPAKKPDEKPDDEETEDDKKDEKEDDDDEKKPSPNDDGEDDNDNKPEVEKKEATKLKKGVLVGTIPKVKKEWDLTFDYKPMNADPKAITSIVRVTASNDNYGKDGDRIPGVFMNSRSLQLTVCSVKDKSPNHCIRTGKLVKGKYSSVHVKQRKNKKGDRYYFSIYVNGAMHKKRGVMTQKFVPKEYDNVKIWSGDKFYKPADAYVKNIVFKNFESPPEKPESEKTEDEKEEEKEEEKEDEKEEKEPGENEKDEPDDDKVEPAEEPQEPEPEPKPEPVEPEPQPGPGPEPQPGPEPLPEPEPEPIVNPEPEPLPVPEPEPVEPEPEPIPVSPEPTEPEEPKEKEKDEDENIDVVNPTEDDDDKWTDKIGVRDTCLEKPLHGSRIKTRKTMRIFIPKGVKVELHQFCGGKPGNLPVLTFCGKTNLDFSKGTLYMYTRIKIITLPRNDEKLPITQDEEEDEKKDREDQEKEEEAAKQEDKDKDDKEGREEDDVDDDVELPHSNSHMLRACDDFKRSQCVFAKDLNTIKQLAKIAGYKITYVFIPSGTYLPVEERIIPKPQPGVPQCSKPVGMITGAVRVLIAELEARLKGNPSLKCAADQEIEAAKVLKKAARRSFLERYSNTPLITWNKAMGKKI